MEGTGLHGSGSRCPRVWGNEVALATHFRAGRPARRQRTFYSHNPMRRGRREPEPGRAREPAGLGVLTCLGPPSRRPQFPCVRNGLTTSSPLAERLGCSGSAAPLQKPLEKTESVSVLVQKKERKKKKKQ